MRAPVCEGTGRGPFHGMGLAPEPYWPFKTLMSEGQWFTCPSCHRRVQTTIEGQRGHWEYRFVEHPRRGVTRQQWQAWKAARA